MRTIPLMLLTAAILMLPSENHAQPNFAPPPAAKKPDEATMAKIEAKRTELRKLCDAGEMSPDVLVYLKALDWIIKHGEWIGKDIDKQTLAVADEGIKRAKAYKKGKELYPPDGKWVARGYKSDIDGSIQPYAVSYPAEYGKDPKKKWRVDVNLHGRNATLTEVSFLAGHQGKATPKEQDYVMIDIYGRGNNAYRWAGENDVWEALTDFLRHEDASGRNGNVDLYRIVLKGFSMGGAGTWHLGLHHPLKWAVMQPGAGFTTTHGYVKLEDKLPYPVEELLTIYDAYRYAGNAFNIPLVAYSGEVDGQKKAADVIEAEMAKKGMKMTHIIAPKLAHVAPKGEFVKMIEAEFAKHIGPAKQPGKYPDEIRFTTYTLKFPEASWLVLLGLDKHYQESFINAERRGNVCKIETSNVNAFMVAGGDDFNFSKFRIDGQDVASRKHPGSYFLFERKGKDWEQSPREFAELMGDGKKRPRRQGPIDDAFTGRFEIVHSKGPGWNPAMDKAIDATRETFAATWDKYFRGVLAHTEAASLKNRDQNLVLFGDPKSNPLIKELLPKLPIQWTEDKITVGDKSFSSKDHMPVLIYPNPWSKMSYVVLNSGHTFGKAEFEGSNAQLYPRLGDYAVLKWDGKKWETVLNGLFDENWQLPKQ